ncbi:histidine kinase [Mucilaginibacter gynuensis]|uniref:Histidine kinase n=1 Tax=Mucilaginibacter gynuensis TaxID=1302236 RepID=A0ABP8G053_9SPHI
MNKLVFRPWFYNIIPLLVWFLLLVLPFVSGPANIPDAMRHHFITQILISNTLLLVMFYIHTYFVYPLLTNKGWAVYTIGLAALLSAYWLWWFFLRTEPPHPPHEFARGFRDSLQGPGYAPNGKPGFGRRMGGGPGAFIPVFSPMIAILCSFCYRILMENASRQQLLKERETIHLRTELNFLRSQINPHFLFNILNNLTSLARKKSDHLEPAIVNLSQLMRYMLYESDDNKVALTKEVNYLKSYIDLQMLRFGNEVIVKLDFDDKYDGIQIGSMLLISLVENAFKHGTSSADMVSIFITLRILPGNKLCFRVMNNVNNDDRNADNTSGIGLKNMQRRLAILYPDKHELKITNDGILFTAELTIDIT